MKWDLNEIKNQILHIITGLIFTYWVLIFHKYLLEVEIYDFRLLFVGLIVGLFVEIYQYFFMDYRELKLDDRIRDTFFYIVGSAIVWLI